MCIHNISEYVIVQHDSYSHWVCFSDTELCRLEFGELVPSCRNVLQSLLKLQLQLSIPSCAAPEDLERASRPPLESGVIISNQFRLSATAGWARRKSRRRLPCRSDTERESAEDSGQGSHDTSLKWHTWLIPFSPLRTPSFLPHLRRPFPLVLLSFICGLSSRTAYETRPSASNQATFCQYKGNISHSTQQQRVFGTVYSLYIQGRRCSSQKVHFNQTLKREKHCREQLKMYCCNRVGNN